MTTENENSSNDTDIESIECFQNYTASEVFVQGLAGLVDQQDVESMIAAQKQMLQRFEKTNEMLSNCNNLSISRLKIAGQQFKNYKQLLVDIKKDLDRIFKRVNVLQSKLKLEYPESYAEISSKATILNDDDEIDQIAESVRENCETTSELTKRVITPTDVGVFSGLSEEMGKKSDKKSELSDEYSSESGGADSHHDTSISTSDS